MELKVVKGDITELEIEAIVNPANSFLYMGGGLAGVIKRKGGVEIEQEARRHAPCPVGKAIVTNSGNLKCNKVIHAPTMKNPAEKIGIENVKLAVKGILDCAEREGIHEIAIPGLGTGVGGVNEEEGAKVIVQTIKEYPIKTIRKIILIGFTEELYTGFLEAL